MTSKIKTVIFTALIAAMILPFSSMDMAEAVSSDAQKNIKKFDVNELRAAISADKEKAQNEKNTAKDSKAAEKADRKLQRLNHFEQLIELKHEINTETDSKKIEQLEVKAQKILTKIQNSVQPEENTTATYNTEAQIQTVAGGNTVSFSTVVTRSPDCENPNTTWGYNSGYGESTSSKTVVDIFTSYTSAIGTGVVGDCTTYNGVYVHDTMTDSNTVCNIWMYPTSGNYSDVTCNGIGWNQVVLVTTQAYYGAGGTFAGNGWTLMVT